MKKLFALTLLASTSLILTNCALVAVGAVGAAAGTTAIVATDPRSSAVVMSDNTIETKLQLKYATNYKSSNIYVTSYNGAILLTGQVPNTQSKESAAFDAKVTPGVRKIYDYLEVRLPESFAARSSDSLTTTQIKTKIVGLKGVNSNSVKVITTDSVVYLFGIVTQKQGQDVANAAASINGVKKVVTLFEYVAG
jgi:osmotically-inducible protein OsmY